jgi:hypothetical protein
MGLTLNRCVESRQNLASASWHENALLALTDTLAQRPITFAKDLRYGGPSSPVRANSIWCFPNSSHRRDFSYACVALSLWAL